MNNSDLAPLYQWYEQIMSHIRESGLINLSEYQTEDGEKPFQKFTDITRSKDTIRPFSYSDFKHGDEFNIFSQDLMYIISVIELLHPKINNVLKENSTYNQTLEDHLYLRYAGFGFDAIYGFWDRIGDILALFFKTGLVDNVYTTKVFNNFPMQYKSATFYMLYELYKKEVEPAIERRHGVVHSFSLKGAFFWGFLEKIANSEELEKLQKEKDGFPELFRRQLELFFKGFTLAMKLISELPDKKVVDVVVIS